MVFSIHSRSTPEKGKDRIPNELMATYYGQRATGGLIVTEATAISAKGYGWLHAPGAYTQEQMAGWKKIVDHVHDKGGKIFLQLWHMGRQSHSSYHEQNEILSASAIAVGSGEVTTASGEKVPYETPRAMTVEEIQETVKDYAACAQRCKDVGFDGVEIHSANGYLLDQFLQTCSNQRNDQYGGSDENRARFLLEVVDAVTKVFPANRVAVRLSPNGAFGGMGSDNNHTFFPWVASKLEEYGLAYLHVMDGLGFGFHNKCRALTLSDFRKVFSGPIMGNVGLTKEVAEGMLRSGAMDLACFGRLYMSNPDLPERFLNNWPTNPLSPYQDWWGATGAKGYTDYPYYSPDEKKEEAK